MTEPTDTPIQWRDREPANVYEAIARVMADLPAIGKDAKADPAQGGYAYRGIEHITSQIETLLAHYGVVPIPELVGEPVITHITVNNKPWTDTMLRVRYRFVHGPSVPDKLDWDRDKGVEQLPPWCQVAAGGPDGFVGIGRDNSDKGANKAMTQCLKVCLIQTFVIGDKASDADQGSPGADAPALAPPGWQHYGYDSEEHYESTRQEVLGAWAALPPVAADSARAWLRDAGHPRKWPLPIELASGLLEIARAEGERAASDAAGEEPLPPEPAAAAPLVVSDGSAGSWQEAEAAMLASAPAPDPSEPVPAPPPDTEPGADAVVKAKLGTLLNRPADRTERARLKTEFAAAFGNPAFLAASKQAEAVAWAEARVGPWAPIGHRASGQPPAAEEPAQASTLERPVALRDEAAQLMASLPTEISEQMLSEIRSLSSLQVNRQLQVHGLDAKGNLDERRMRLFVADARKWAATNATSSEQAH